MAVAETDVVLRALADPTRRAVLRLVRDAEVPAGAIAARFPTMSRPAVSQHLGVLAGTGLVRVRSVGNRRLYSLSPQPPAGVVALIADLWADDLSRLKAAAERRARR